MRLRRNRGRASYERWDQQEYLDSINRGLYFEVRIRLFGFATAAADEVGDPALAGADRLRAVFEKVTTHSSLVRWHAVRQALADVLLQQLPFSVPGAEFREGTVVVEVRSRDLEAAMAVEHARHELELDELAHRQIRARMRFLREECLRDPAAAELFALLPPSPRLAGSGPAADPEQLVKLVRKWDFGSGWVRAANKLMEFGDKLTPGQLVMLGSYGRDVMTGFSEAELGQQFADALAAEARARHVAENGQAQPEGGRPDGV